MEAVYDYLQTLSPHMSFTYLREVSLFSQSSWVGRSRMDVATASAIAESKSGQSIVHYQSSEPYIGFRRTKYR
jgi:hypothetical protein